MKRIKNNLKEIIVGRKTSFVDKTIFKIFHGHSSGWKIGNELRTLFYGRKQYVSQEKIIIVGGYPRSGTSLMHVILDKHPEIASPKEEVNLLQDTKERKILMESFEFNGKETSIILNEKDLIKIDEKISKIYRKKKGAKRVLFKQPKHIFLIDGLFKHFPNAKFINLVRDGRDATMSQRYYCLYNGVKEWPYEWCCRQWVTCLKIAKKWEKDKRFLNVKYEDLVLNPHKELIKIMKFLEVKIIPVEDLLDYKDSLQKTRYKTHPNLKEGLNRKGLGKGLKKMNEKDKEIFKKIAGRKLIKLGYEKNNNW